MVACQVCGNLTITDYAEDDICPVCFWQDDGLYADPDEVRGGPNKDLSLSQARRNYQEFGAFDREFIGKVRAPLPQELPAEHNLDLSELYNKCDKLAAMLQNDYPHFATVVSSISTTLRDNQVQPKERIDSARAQWQAIAGGMGSINDIAVPDITELVGIVSSDLRRAYNDIHKA